MLGMGLKLVALLAFRDLGEACMAPGSPQGL